MLAFLRKEIGEAEIIEQLQTYVRFKIGEKASVGNMFDKMEENKTQLSIQQYSIKQASVEQIFNRFAEGNEEMD